MTINEEKKKKKKNQRTVGRIIEAEEYYFELFHIKTSAIIMKRAPLQPTSLLSSFIRAFVFYVMSTFATRIASLQPLNYNPFAHGRDQFTLIVFSFSVTDSTCWGLIPKNEKQRFQIQITTAMVKVFHTWCIQYMHNYISYHIYMNSIIRLLISWEWWYIMYYIS